MEPPAAATATLYHQGPPSGEEPHSWSPILEKPCTFSAGIFLKVMHEMILNPNYNSSWILRADILSDTPCPPDPGPHHIHIQIPTFTPNRTILRRFIPRNPQRDPPAEQTCVFYASQDATKLLVVFHAHATEPSDLPYYLPTVRALAFLYLSPLGAPSTPSISIHYHLFPTTPLTERLSRTALHLLTRIHKLGNGFTTGYEKRVHHDQLIPRERFQTTYLALRERHAARLISRWAEKTDPRKHVFEDILIAALLVELWRDMGRGADEGFVDIGCGNGVLVDVLVREGYIGWGFDARRRKSWGVLGEETEPRLKEMVLIPRCLMEGGGDGGATDGIHDGEFEEGTFIISNHADELTPWTPLLAAQSRCPFLMIPCCSHDLSGRRHRQPGKGSQYASLVEWVAKLADDVGWEVEREVLRIPSTRNIGIIGRQLRGDGMVMGEILKREGSCSGWAERALALRTVSKGH